MRILTLLAMSVMSLAVAAPSFAQDAMAKDGMHAGTMARMSAANTRQMQRCNAMTHTRMMHNRTCARMARMHPSMMRHEGAMNGQGAMSHDSMMKSGH